MMIVKHFTIGNTKITINDASCVKTREEAEQILRSIGKIYTDAKEREVKHNDQ